MSIKLSGSRRWPGLVGLLLAILPSAPSLAAEIRIEGIVLAAGHQPIPAAQVIVRRSSDLFRVETTCDNNGRFSLAVDQTGPYLVRASAAGFQAQEVELRVEVTTSEVELVLEAGSFADHVEVVGTRLAASDEARERLAGSYDHLERSDLVASQVSQFNEALRKIPAVFARDEEGLALRPNIGLRGLNPTRSSKVLLLEDGIFLTFAPYGDNASYYHPPVERFDGIEVVKGAGQIAFGPTTTGGVVNYLTPAPPESLLRRFRLAGGDRDFLSAQAAMGDRLELASWRVDLLHKQGDGARENVGSEIADVAVKWQLELDDRRSVNAKATWYHEDSQVTYSGLTLAEFQAAPRQNPFANDHFDGERLGLAAKYAWLVHSRFDLSSQVYASAFDRDWWRQSSNSNQRPNDFGDPQCGGMANLTTTCGNEGRLRQYRQYGFDQRGRFSFQLAESFFEGEAGIRFHHEEQERRQENGDTPLARSGRLVENNYRESEAWSGFFAGRWLTGRFTFNLGLRLEAIDHARTNRLANQGAGASGTANIQTWVPGVGIAYSPSHRFTLFAGVHRGFAPPRAEDVISQTGGVIELDAEKSWIYEMGFRATPQSGLEVAATLFELDYENQIVPASLAGGIGSSLTNGGATRHQGLEASLRVDSKNLWSTRHDFYARLAYTELFEASYVGERFSSVPGFAQVDVSGNRLPYAPERLASATLGYRHPRGLNAQLEAVVTGEQFGDDLNTVASSADGQRGLLPATTLWNLALNLELRHDLGAFFTVKNLTDELYIADRSRGILPGPPRQFQAGLSFEF